ncbi:MAG: hypothetical protein ACE5GM_03755 [bacterium]
MSEELNYKETKESHGSTGGETPEHTAPPSGEVKLDGSMFEREMKTALEAIKDLRQKLELSFNMQDALQNDLKKAKEELREVQQEKLDFNTRLSKQNDLIEEKKLVAERLQDELSFLEEEKLDGDEKIRTLQDKLRNRDTELQNTRNDLESLKVGLQGEKERYAELKREGGLLKSELTEAEAELSSERISKEEALRRCRDLETELSNLRSSREALLEIRKALVDTNNKVRDHFYQADGAKPEDSQ